MTKKGPQVMKNKTISLKAFKNLEKSLKNKSRIRIKTCFRYLVCTFIFPLTQQATLI